MQFIHRKSNFLSTDECVEFIDKFEKSKFQIVGKSYKIEDGKYLIMSESEMVERKSKKSTDIGFYPGFMLDETAIEEGWSELLENLHDKLFDALDEYQSKFQYSNTVNKIELQSYNLQRYLPGEGFYRWHCENPGFGPELHRCFAWMVYLNDVDDGGTEFLYQNHTEKAEAGKFLMWPAWWTHMHRGQISETKTKYILTGWFRYKE
jgi:hypothetical protein